MAKMFPELRTKKEDNKQVNKLLGYFQIVRSAVKEVKRLFHRYIRYRISLKKSSENISSEGAK